MSDIIDEIDRLHAEATPGPWRLSEGGCYIDGKDGEVADCSSERNGRLIHALLNNWPALRDRLREAERRAKAFDLIASGRIGISRNNTNYRQWVAWQSGEGGSIDGQPSLNPDLLTAIETALRGEEKSK
jgi:hypothetical protein